MTSPTVPSQTKLRANDPCWCGSGKKFKRCHKAAGGRVIRGVITPRRTVPSSIDQPPWASTGGGSNRAESDVKSPELIARLRRTGREAADILAELGAAIGPGVTTDELDAICHDACLARGGYPSPLNYNGYPKSLCTSVNEVICHGIPDDRPLQNGDIVNLDVTFYREGVHGDTNATWCVGMVHEDSRRLVRVTRECLERGIEAVRPGRPISDIGRAVQDHAEAHRFGVVRSFVGHGIGETFHTDLAILHYYDGRASKIMEPGMVFTIEPMITAGDWRHRMWDDEWTAVTVDGRRSAQFEHTILVTEAGADVLTLRSDGSWNGDDGGARHRQRGSSSTAS